MSKRETNTILVEKEKLPQAAKFDFVETSTAASAPKPEFKNNYSSHKLNKVYNQIDLDNFAEEHSFKQKQQEKQVEIKKEVVPLQKPKSYTFDMVLDAQDSEVPELEVNTYSAPRLKAKRSLLFGSKIFIASAAVVATLFCGLLVYNFVEIGQNLGRIDATQTALDAQTASLEGTIAEYLVATGSGALTEEALELGLVPNQNGNPIKVNIKPKREEVNYNVVTNLFDRICNFIAGIFGR
ncbi:MAG: hypothetical protein FWE53_03655 [Firmicutes bacterium]|nr:hypothetical protein [Bacillota bacterium]